MDLTIEGFGIDVDLVEKVFRYYFKLPDFFGIQTVVGSRPAHNTLDQTYTFELLEMLVDSSNTLLSRESALKAIWGSDDYFTARSMDVYITKLRKYLAGDSNISIKNIHGAGFQMIINDD